ncbi:MAG TPA: methylated-DNA--[protein]-cysteine S-methyltransferase [Gaiellaceae bacterium]|nr:methylated-DNA--[protein]-cysteine S-methyltransferase [Gaiellaceae bacterium]
MRTSTVAYEVEGWGVGKIWLDGDRLLHHELPRAGDERAAGGHPLAERLQAYFAGADDSFADVALDLEGESPFQRAVADALRSVPRGETVTYGELAALAGYPNAHRAAGTVCARNRFPIFVPCHRVTAANGLGRFGELGTGYKQRLLALERSQ